MSKPLIYSVIAAVALVLFQSLPSKLDAPAVAELKYQLQYGGPSTEESPAPVLHNVPAPAVPTAEPPPTAPPPATETSEGVQDPGTAPPLRSSQAKPRVQEGRGAASAPTKAAAARLRPSDMERPYTEAAAAQNTATTRCSPSDAGGGNAAAWRAQYKPHFTTGLNKSYSEHLAWYSCSRQKNMKEHYLGKSKEIEFTGDQQRLNELWPKCFDLPSPIDTTTDLRVLLRNETWRQEVKEITFPDKRDIRRNTVIRGNIMLNSLGLTLNPELRPREPFVPLLITSFYKAKVRLKNCFSKLRAVDFVQDTILYIAMEGYTIEILEIIAEMMTYMYTRIYFIPIGMCCRYAQISENIKYERDFWMNKNFKINLSFLWIMNVMMNMKGYEYVAVVEDDMKAQPDFYVHHLVLSRYAMARPDIAAVMTTTAGDYYDCSGLLLKHLRAQFDGVYDVCETNLLYLAKPIMPWGAGYKRDFFLRIFNRYLRKGLLETVKKNKCRYDAVMNYVNGPNIYALYPMVARCHGDPRYYMEQRRLFPALHCCNHTHYKIIAPEPLKTDVVLEDFGYDWRELPPPPP